MSLLVGPWLAKQMYQVSLATLGEEPGLLAQTPEWSWAFWGAALSRRRQHQQLCLFVSPWQSLRQTRFLSCGTQMLPLRSACLLEQHSLGGKKKKRKKKQSLSLWTSFLSSPGHSHYLLCSKSIFSVLSSPSEHDNMVVKWSVIAVLANGFMIIKIKPFKTLDFISLVFNRTSIWVPSVWLERVWDIWPADRWSRCRVSSTWAPLSSAHVVHAGSCNWTWMPISCLSCPSSFWSTPEHSTSCCKEEHLYCHCHWVSNAVIWSCFSM